MTNCHGGIISSSSLKCYFCDCLDLFVLQEKEPLVSFSTDLLLVGIWSVNFSSLHCTGEMMECLSLNTVALYYYN